MKDSSNLDYLRAVAVLCVFGFHLTDALTDMRYDAQIAKFGILGVILFFVHTSLVLMQSLERSNLTGVDLALSFYIRRAFRIYPLAILCITIAAFLSWPGTITYLANLALMQNISYSTPSVWGVLWSLPLEVQMYIVLPIFFLAFRSRPVWQLMVFWALSMVFGTVWGALTAKLNTISYSPCFISGILAWRIMRRQRTHQLKAWIWPFALAGMIVLWALWGNHRQVWNRGLFCIGIGLLLPYFSDLKSKWITIPAKKISKYSYGIYLSHPLAINLAMQNHGLMRWTILIGLLIFIPVIAFHALEDPLIRLGKRVADRIRIKQDSLTQAA